jgi:four helix bundle protein
MKRKHHELRVWQDGIAMVKLVYGITARFPKEELFGLISQMRRCAVSIPTNVGEGAARSTSKEFAHFLTIARGSLSELETPIIISRELGYMLDGTELDDAVQRQFGALGSLIKVERGS